MAKTTINASELAAQIAKELQQYSGEVVEHVNASSKEVAKRAVKQLKKTSPKDTGKYAKSWRTKTEKGKSAQVDKRIVYNKEGQLTHLLERGHAKVGGGRVEPRPHIKPAEDQVIKEFMAEVEEAVKRG